MSFKVKRTIKAKFPAFRLDDATMVQLGELLSLGVVDNILQQKQASGARIRPNAPSTRHRKQRLGRPVLSLIDDPKKHRFIKGGKGSFTYSAKGHSRGTRTIVVEPATGELRKLNRYVQQKGYVGWFGVSRETEAAVRLALRDFIKRTFRERFRRVRG